MTQSRLRADGTRPTPAERGRARRILTRLLDRYPAISTALEYLDPWQLLVATVISAQTTDENVNRATPELFDRYPNSVALAQADPRDVEKIIFSTGFYRQKTKSIVDLSRDLVERFDGIVPDTIEELVELRGVGRKTASVVLAEAFGQSAIAVDTHVRRLSNRLALSGSADPDKIEIDLKSLFPPLGWRGLSMRFIQYGRDVCVARTPRCFACDLVDLCPFPDKTSPVL
ncbi:MAG: endonuclease III [Acidimicrobiia bacterium]|nr:endonuclease III [Acidimicrobiia bacterium]MDH3396463.1 endonuclease III [Acidimicrobiia bacterium]